MRVIIGRKTREAIEELRRRIKFQQAHKDPGAILLFQDDAVRIMAACDALLKVADREDDA